MSACQSDAVAHKCPHTRDYSTADGDDLQRTGGALRKSENAESRLKRLVSAANNHQTQMHYPTADKQPDHNEQRQHDDHRSRADTHPGHCDKTVIPIRKKAEGLETEREQKRHDATHASTDKR